MEVKMQDIYVTEGSIGREDLFYYRLLEFFIMNQFEYNGLWWLPENPTNKISGILRFHPIGGIATQAVTKGRLFWKLSQLCA
jgi:hypothetical protein